jgi:ABC-type bacteriocin/lantibiotic exporter with double-glycine peptidase domain
MAAFCSSERSATTRRSFNLRLHPTVARLGDILNTAAEPTYNPARAALPAIRGDIAFEHVTFRYRVDGA